MATSVRRRSPWRVEAEDDRPLDEQEQEDVVQELEAAQAQSSRSAFATLAAACLACALWFALGPLPCRSPARCDLLRLSLAANALASALHALVGGGLVATPPMLRNVVPTQSWTAACVFLGIAAPIALEPRCLSSTDHAVLLGPALLACLVWFCSTTMAAAREEVAGLRGQQYGLRGA